MLDKFDALHRRAGPALEDPRCTAQAVLTAGEHAGSARPRRARRLLDPGSCAEGMPFAPAGGRRRHRHDRHQQPSRRARATSRRARPSSPWSCWSIRLHERATRRSTWWPRPTGRPVAMVHCNNCTNDINAWVGLLRRVRRELFGRQGKRRRALHPAVSARALEGAGGLRRPAGLQLHGRRGHHRIWTPAGPLVDAHVRTARLTLANFMRSHLYLRRHGHA